MAWSIIVHGGAGKIPDSLGAEHRQGCEAAVSVGAELLAQGGSALDAVCAAVRVLEDNPLYNSGIGAAMDENGLPALDAALMRASDVAYGALGAVVGVRSAIEGARAVLEDGRHCLLAGPEALGFLRRAGVALCDPQLHLTEKTQSEWARRKAKLEAGIPAPATAEWAPLEEEESRNGNTVGCVARDQNGEIVAGTSTGGLLMRYGGRVGDTPIAGAGTYADPELGGASATGHGETMLRTVFSLQALYQLRSSPNPHEALHAALEHAKVRAGGTGGIIVIDPQGSPHWARNTPHMGVSWQKEGQELRSAF